MPPSAAPQKIRAGWVLTFVHPLTTLLAGHRQRLDDGLHRVREPGQLRVVSDPSARTRQHPQQHTGSVGPQVPNALSGSPSVSGRPV